VKNVLAGIGRIWPTIFAGKGFSYTFFDDDIAKLYEKEQKTSRLLRLTMVIAIFISCMGLLGLATFAAEQRSKEVSIRKVLGASVTRIASMLTTDFLWPVALAIVIATPVAWYFVQAWLQDFAYRTNIPWWIFAVCGLAAVVIAMLTVGYQAVRAAVRNPVESLRNE
jgi:putative ABC transport system permease protein